MPFMKPGLPFLYDDVSGDVVGIKDADGGESYPFAPRMTFAQMKALTRMVDGQMTLVTNYGRGGSTWRYSAADGDWFPIAPVKVYENTGIITGIAQTADQLLLAIPCEAGLLANKLFRLIVSFGKNGTTDASGTFSFRMGAAGTTSDTQVASAVGSVGASSRSIGFDIWARMAGATSVNKVGGLPIAGFSAGASSALLNAAATVANVSTQTTYVTLTTTMGGSTDAPQLGYVALEIQA